MVGSALQATQGRSAPVAAAMLPALHESLDGDEKELESSEEGGSAEERRLEPPPSSHYSLYGYRGSRCHLGLGPAASCIRSSSLRPGRSLTPFAFPNQIFGLNVSSMPFFQAL